MNASYRFWGIFFALAGTIAFAFRPVLIKMGYGAHPVSATTLLFLRMTLSLPFFLAMAWWAGRNDPAAAPIARRDCPGSGPAARIANPARSAACWRFARTSVANRLPT